ncbi:MULTISPECIES: GLPGLI family protein [unclassified Chryseobacterium]|uniref:GLPGLI family protein n=1 Tax=unclassified Chryseobacterium TaxID=2593645 RepID=UPI002853271A|nr:GLPGLI family protein [Chryseobacterium sp. CFS7]MDR4894987.1 GLPGLI family protein [Chryseobacterium sp. CFS7]
MKRSFNIFFCFLLILIKSQTPKQEKNLSILEVKYNFSYLEDTLNAKNLISEPMILLTNGKKSLYYSENDKAFSDGFKKQLDAAIKTGSIVEPGKLLQSKVRHSVYKDNDSLYISNYLGRDFYTIYIEGIHWKIDNLTNKIIQGYKCTKAVAKVGRRTYIAWFTYDVPINDGPYKFKGLPGLILKVNDESQYFNFELLSITKINLPISYKKGLLITKDQYLAKRKEYSNDPSQGKINTPAYRKRINENKNKFNNFLEE